MWTGVGSGRKLADGTAEGLGIADATLPVPTGPPLAGGLALDAPGSGEVVGAGSLDVGVGEVPGVKDAPGAA